MTITKAHLHDLFVRWDMLNVALRLSHTAKDVEEWHDGFKALCTTAESYGLDVIAWYYVRTFFDFVDDVNDGLAADERFWLITQTLTQIGVEITEEED